MINIEKLRELTAFQHWLGTNYDNLPTDSGTMTERARRYLVEMKPEPSIENTHCKRFLTWTECPELYDQCTECPHYTSNSENVKPIKIGIIGNVTPVDITFIEALVRSVENKLGEKIEFVNVHSKDVEFLTQKLPIKEVSPPFIVPIDIPYANSDDKRKGHERPYKFHP